MKNYAQIAHLAFAHENHYEHAHMIRAIKFIHTIIWLIMALATFYVLYAGIMHVQNKAVIVAIVLVLSEVAVLLLNRWTCPLTPIAKKYTTDRSDNFDIYLPLWLAKYNKLIFGIIFAIGMILIVINGIGDAYIHS